MLSALVGAGPYALFLGMCLYQVLDYRRGRIISPGELARIQAGHKEAMAQMQTGHAEAIETERRITGYHEKRAEVAEARADKADAALRALNAELPAALHALARANVGAS